MINSHTDGAGTRSHCFYFGAVFRTVMFHNQKYLSNHVLSIPHFDIFRGCHPLI